MYKYVNYLNVEALYIGDFCFTYVCSEFSLIFAISSKNICFKGSSNL